jgi:hypothetical protein
MHGHHQVTWMRESIDRQQARSAQPGMHAHVRQQRMQLFTMPFDPRHDNLAIHRAVSTCHVLVPGDSLKLQQNSPSGNVSACNSRPENSVQPSLNSQRWRRAGVPAQFTCTTAAGIQATYQGCSIVLSLEHAAIAVEHSRIQVELQ